MLPNQSQIAFKEWAVTVNALAQGQQVLLLRKGGIHEVTKDFRIAHPEFLLYPTYEHQNEDLLKPSSQSLFQETLTDSSPAGTVTFSYWAQVTETIKVAELEKYKSYLIIIYGPMNIQSLDSVGNRWCHSQSCFSACLN